MPITERDQQEIFLNQEVRRIDELYPSLRFIPNIGQEKAFSYYKHYENSPHIFTFGGGNGVGKTADMVIFMVGLIFGSDYLNDFFDKYKVFDEYHEHVKRRQRQGIIRLLVHADSMKPGGSVYQAITEWFPKGEPGKPLYRMDKNGKQYFSEIKIFIEDAPIVEVKTHDQPLSAHSGTTLDWILCDEPFPRSIWGEMIGRTRDGGKIAMFLTPLNMAGWLMDEVIDHVDGVNNCMVNAPIWDNCADIPGTRGRLRKKNIDMMIDNWQRSDPDSVEARVNGTFTHLSGAIFKIFNPVVHICDPFEIPEDWPVVHILDPHDSRPAFAMWILQGPNNQHWVIKEWPTEDVTKMGPTSLTIQRQAQILREEESKFYTQIVDSIMDPNKGSFVYSNTKSTVQDEWRKVGRTYRLCRNDDLEVGHNAVNQLLYYDKNKPVSKGFNEPSLKVWRSCTNTTRALQRYGFKKNFDPGASLTSKIDKTHKDPVDDVRYYAVDSKAFQSLSDRRSFMDRINAKRRKIEYK